MALCFSVKSFSVTLTVVIPDLIDTTYAVSSTIAAIQEHLSFPVSEQIIRRSQWVHPWVASDVTSSIYYVINRDGRAVNVLADRVTAATIAEFMESATRSYVEYLDETSVKEFEKSESSVFIMRGSEPADEYEDVAFHLRFTKTRCGFLKSNESSVVFLDNKRGLRREYDSRIGLRHWMKTCKVPKTGNLELRDNVTKHRCHLTAITNTQKDLAMSAWNSISGDVSSVVDFDVREWENATDLLGPCLIQEDNLTIVLHNVGARKGEFCWVYPDVDVFSPESLQIFVQKMVKGGLQPDMTEKFPALAKAHSIQQLSLFSAQIPDPRFLSVILFNKQTSFSSMEAYLVFSSVAADFEHRNVLFYYADGGPGNIPTHEGFPLFVMYRPNNQQPLVFREMFSRDALNRWIEPHIPDVIPELIVDASDSPGRSMIGKILNLAMKLMSGQDERMANRGVVRSGDNVITVTMKDVAVNDEFAGEKEQEEDVGESSGEHVEAGLASETTNVGSKGELGLDTDIDDMTSKEPSVSEDTEEESSNFDFQPTRIADTELPEDIEMSEDVSDVEGVSSDSGHVVEEHEPRVRDIDDGNLAEVHEPTVGSQTVPPNVPFVSVQSKPTDVLNEESDIAPETAPVEQPL